MEAVHEVLIKDLTHLGGLCRVCLTESKKMTSLKEEVDQNLEQKARTAWQLLYRVTGIEIPYNEEYPSFICPMCMSMLKMAYQFKLRFETSQKLLDDYFGECNVRVNVKDLELPSVVETVCMGSPLEPEVAPVELISALGKFDLKDVFIVENNVEEKPDYSAFLKNLGREISACFVHERAVKLEDACEGNNITILSMNFNQDSALMKLGEEINVPELKNDPNITSNGRMGEESNLQQDLPDNKYEMDKIPKKTSRSSKCSICQKIFGSKRYLQLHVDRVHLKIKETYVCELCGIVLTSRSSHYHHMLKHYGKKNKCTYCQKTYFNGSALKLHIMAVHKNMRLHLCTICGQSFNYSNALDYHMRIHNNERKYRCTYCDKTFRMQCGLNRHLRTHTGVRPYKCSYCEKAFRSKGEVDCHEMTHTGFRPYHCKYCGKGFTKTYNLKMHLLGHSGQHACEICNKTFIEVQFLKIHMRNYHGIKEEDGHYTES